MAQKPSIPMVDYNEVLSNYGITDARMSVEANKFMNQISIHLIDQLLMESTRLNGQGKTDIDEKVVQRAFAELFPAKEKQRMAANRQPKPEHLKRMEAVKRFQDEKLREDAISDI